MNAQVVCFVNDELGFDVNVVDQNGDPWYTARSVCDSLGIKNVSDATRGLDSEDLTSIQSMSGGQKRETLIVSESGMYQMVMQSRKPKAKPFIKWLSKEVIPSIRRTGSYSVDHNMGDVSEVVELAKGIIAQNKRIEHLKKRDNLFGNRTPFGEISEDTGCPKQFPVRGYLRSDRRVRSVIVTEYQLDLF